MSFGNSQKKWCQRAKHLSGFVEQTRAAYKQHQPPANQNWWNRTFVVMKKDEERNKKGSCPKEFFDTCTLQRNESCEECLKMNQDCWDTKDSPLHIWFQGGIAFLRSKRDQQFNTKKHILEAQTQKESLGESMQHPPKKRSPKNPSLSKKIWPVLTKSCILFRHWKKTPQIHVISNSKLDLFI